MVSEGVGKAVGRAIDNGEVVVSGNGRHQRANLSGSPLSRPKSDIHRLVGQLQNYIHMPSPEPLYVTLATVAGNCLTGNPLWVMLVGAASSGKTLQIDMLGGWMHDPEAERPDGKRIHTMGAIKTEGALLSGVKKAEVTKGATGGLLRAVGTRGILVTRDFARMLSQPKEEATEMIGALRDVYDREYVRPVGTDGGRALVWRGRVGFLGAVTNEIDRYGYLIKSLGERWIYYRFEDSDGYQETIKSMRQQNPVKTMLEMQGLVSEFLNGLGLTWDDTEERRALVISEENRIEAMAAVGTKARSPVPRDKFSCEITDPPSIEGTARMAGALQQMYLGLERIGVEADERWSVVGRMALDSIPFMKGKALMTLRQSWDINGSVGLVGREIQGELRVGTRATELTLEDLEVLGLIERLEKHKNRYGGGARIDGVWRLTGWTRKQIDLGWPKC